MRNNMNTIKSWIGSSCLLCLIATGSIHAAGNDDVHEERIMGERSPVITPSQPVMFQRVVQAPLKLRLSYHLRYGTTNDYQKAVKKSQLAATAAASGMTVATRDTSPFAAMGLSVINPWMD